MSANGSVSGLHDKMFKYGYFFKGLPKKNIKCYGNLFNYFGLLHFACKLRQFINKNPKVLQMDGFVLVLAATQGLNFNLVRIIIS